MDVKPLKTENDYKIALQMIERLFDAAPNTPDGDALEILAIIVEDYEKKYHKISLPDPIDALEYYLDSHNLRQSSLVPYIGSRGRVSEILNRKRRLTLDMIRSLEKGTGIPANILIQPYKLANELRYGDEYLATRPGATKSALQVSDNNETKYGTEPPKEK